MQIQLRIGGELRDAAEGGYFDIRSPLSGEVVTRAAAANVADAVAAVDAAHAAFEAWSETGPNHRRQLVQRAAQLLEERAEQFVSAIVDETGTSNGWARFNIQGTLGALREAAALATQVTGEQIPSDKPGSLAITVRAPAGVVLGMAPWNAPLMLGMRAVLMPLVCGNTVVLKASEQCPTTHHLLGELLLDAGFPPGAINVITHEAQAAPAIVEALIAHPAVRRINFTGSTRVGRIIGELAGKHLKPALLELGGKAPLVVLEDANIDQAVNAAAFGAFMNQGQICMSTERIIVDGKIADAFAQALATKGAALKAGDPRSGNPPLGALISEAAADQVQALIDDAVAKGAKLLTPVNRSKAFIDPVVLDHVTSDMYIYQEESFGPIASIVRVNSPTEAVRVANDTEYGLAGAVYGRDIARTLSVARRIQCGICHINAATVNSEPQLPFGGVKASGYGRFGGAAAIQEFTDLRVLTIQTQDQAFPF